MEGVGLRVYNEGLCVFTCGSKSINTAVYISVYLSMYHSQILSALHKSVNETSSEVSLAPVSCTVGRIC